MSFREIFKEIVFLIFGKEPKSGFFVIKLSISALKFDLNDSNTSSCRKPVRARSSGIYEESLRKFTKPSNNQLIKKYITFLNFLKNWCELLRQQSPAAFLIFSKLNHKRVS